MSKHERRSNRRKPQAAAGNRAARRAFAWVSWIDKRSRLVFLLLVSVASLRIVSTYHVFNETSDEPAHLAAGMEWLTNGIYRYEPQHPPLARVATALGPYLAGARSTGAADIWDEGVAVLYQDGHHDRNLTLARLGVLPFFWVACLVVYLYGRRYLGEPSTAFAVFSFTLLPPVLAHAGLATTDMPLTAMTGAAFLAGLAWFATPSWGNSAIFGGLTGLAVLAKFSSLVFMPCAFAAAFLWYVVCERPRLSGLLRAAGRYLLPCATAVFVAAAAIWAGYRFSFGAVPSLALRLPAPELYAGIQQLVDHNRAGHPAYLLGEHARFGWWYFFLVALAVKTPLPFFALLLGGVVLDDRTDTPHPDRRRSSGLALAFSLGILLFSLSSHINIGLRHVLPVYIGFSLVAGVGAARLAERGRTSRLAGWALGFLLVCFVGTSVLSHPDYLPYFNALAGDAPERILVDSDLDWGQDLKRLCTRLREVGAPDVMFVPFFKADPAFFGCPPVRTGNAGRPMPGWTAVNVTVLKALRFGLFGDHDEITLWQDQIPPTEKIGKGIWLWYTPP